MDRAGCRNSQDRERFARGTAFSSGRRDRGLNNPHLQPLAQQGIPWSNGSNSLQIMTVYFNSGKKAGSNAPQERTFEIVVFSYRTLHKVYWSEPCI